MLLHTWLPDTLRGAGLKVVETVGWRGRSHGQLPGTIRVVWHHDASPAGDSPGALQWMISNWDNSSANIWVDNYGTWYLVGTGVSWHAGRVLPGMPDNYSSIGIETDQTVGEAWPPAQLDSLRKGTAAIFRKQNVPADWLHFHKTICSPPGRKQDPAGLELAAERSTVGRLLAGGGGSATTPPPTTTPPQQEKDWFDMATQADLTKAINDATPAIAKAVWSYMVGGGGAGATLEEVRKVNRDINGKVSKLVDPRNGNVPFTG